MGLIRRPKLAQRATERALFSACLNFSAEDEPILPVELPAVSDSGRGILLTDRMAVGAKEFWSGNHVLENGAWVGPYMVVRRLGEDCWKPLDTESTRPIVMPWGGTEGLRGAYV